MAEDMITVLVTDHREVEDIFTQLEQQSGQTGEDIENLATQVVAELVRHSVAEEAYLYPTTREVLPDGDAIADREIDEHAEAERTMKRLEALNPTQAEFWPTLTSLMTEIRAHIQEEENDLFPRLREACTKEQLEELGGKIETAKKVAPTRPHPSAPDTPPANKLLAPGAGLVDRIRDALSGRQT
jgi:hemerythrin superfamily protein